MVTAEGMPRDVSGLVRSAQAQLDLGRPEAASFLLDKALQRNPACAEANILRGLLFVGQGDYYEGAKAFHRAVMASQEDGNAWMLLGAALFETGDRVEALRALERACELAPCLADAWYNLGRTYKLVSRFADANAALRRAITLGSANTNARLTLADVEVTQGRIHEGIAQFKAVLLSEPGNARAWFGLANLKTHPFDAADTACLLRAIEHPGIVEQSRIMLDFALVKAREDQGDYAGAWQTLRDANARDHHLRPWDRRHYQRKVTKLMQAFAALPTSLPMSERGHEVIFIISMPRAGSTLVEHILASHRDVTGGNETHALSDVIAGESKRRGDELLNWISSTTSADWARLGSEYLERTARFREEQRYFTDKSLGTWEWIGILRRMLPGAHLVHCHRDPLENCFSCYRQWFIQDCKFSNDLDDLVSYYADYRRLIDFWEARRPDGLFDLSYEALVAAPKLTIRRLLMFCNLSYDAACLTPERTERAVTSTASAAQVRQPIYRDTPWIQRYGALLDPLRQRLMAYGLV